MIAHDDLGDLDRVHLVAVGEIGDWAGMAHELEPVGLQAEVVLTGRLLRIGRV